MRLDKFFSSTGTLSRSECAKALKKGEITVNGVTAKKGDIQVNPETDEIALLGNIITYEKFVYIILNKPQGVVSATTDKRDKTLIDLLPPKFARLNLFPCGRLDKDTLGIVVLTNDGQSAHKVLSPKSHVEKTYLFKTADEYTDADVDAIQSGIRLKDGYTTKPCAIKRINSFEGEITLTEGKYHEIKRLFGARGNKIVYLERISFGGITISDIPLGNWRFMTEEEIKIFTK